MQSASTKDQATTRYSVGAGVAFGFAGVLVLMVSLVVVAVLRVNDMNAHLEAIVNSSNVKIEAAHAMIRALNNRAIAMHAIATLRDPFDRDEAYQQFNNEGGRYSMARERLESQPLDREERLILTRIKVLTRDTQPITEQAIDEALAGDADLSFVARTKAIPAQKQIADELDNLVELQQKQAQEVLDDAQHSAVRTVALMLVLGLATISIGVAIAVFASRKASKQAAQLQEQALYDGLTKLANRVLFSERLEQTILRCQRDGQCFALIAIDIDGFKATNDTLGHGAGDRLLQEVAQRLRAALRMSDTVARMGGDEFSVLLPTANSIDGAAAVARKLIDTLKTPMALEQKQLTVSASFGVAIYPEHGTDATALTRHADAAMYAAKRAHSGFEVYQDKFDEKILVEYNLQSELREAASANDQLVLYYQPKVDFADGRLSGVEALVRWQHPTHGLLMPNKFIALAEQAGIIGALTERVLILALQQIRTWQKEGTPTRIAVNVSTMNIQDVSFPGLVERLLAEYATPPELLEFEVTETAVMANPERAVACIERLHVLGIEVAIDDFGTGYSSMTYLKQLRVSTIKIDRSFVADMLTNHSGGVIVRSTIELGHNLGLKVVAEGIEDQRIWDALRALGCDTAQGYYLSRPLAATAIMDWIHQHQRGGSQREQPA